MKKWIAGAVALCAATITMAEPAAARCTAKLKIDNRHYKSVNLLSCATQKKGSSKWKSNLAGCFYWAWGGRNDLNARSSYTAKPSTDRRPRTEFRFQVTYKFDREANTTQTAYSNFSTCKAKGHFVELN